jgi:glycosyltransferase involved in cell wall biosynthesis
MLLRRLAVEIPGFQRVHLLAIYVGVEGINMDISLQNDDIELSIVMPCLNEAETLAICIRKAQGFIQKHQINAEIIVSDNGSSDGSQLIAASNGAQVVQVKDGGYGSTLHGGIAAARGKYIIMGDADDSYDFSDLYPFIEKLREGFDLVMGCRLPMGGGHIMPGAMPLKHRLFGNPVLSYIGKRFFHSSITDFHCGLRGFTKEAFIRMHLQTTGMEFASEMVIAATLLKIKMIEVPITLYRDGRSRPPHLRSWRDGWRHLRFMLMYCPRWLFLYPGVFIFIIGAAIILRIFVGGPIMIGRIGLESNSLLVAGMSILIGFQLTSFYIFTKVFAITEGFLPKDPIIERFKAIYSLEIGVIVGTVLFVVGLFFLGSAILAWQQVGFGGLSQNVKFKNVIPAIIMMLLGVQVFLSSFFLSILGLRRKHSRQAL